MKLPQISLPTYEVKLLSKKDPVKIRPFTVREEKLMLMAVEAKDLESTVNALKQIISNCVIGEFDVEEMPMIDMEIMFLNLRARSVGEIGTQFYKCKNEVTINPPPNPDKTTTKECGMLLEIPINFLEVPIVNKDTETNIKFTDEIGVKLKFPSFSLIRKLTKANPEKDDMELIIATNCLDMIYDKDTVYHAKDCTQVELEEFILGLRTEDYDKIKEFCNKVPKTQLISKKQCKKCGYEHTFTLEGIEDFFV
jgi:hypothetical protein